MGADGPCKNLADNRMAASLIDGSIESIRSEVNGARSTRTQNKRRIHVDSIGATNSISGNSITSDDTPTSIKSISRIEDPGVTDNRSALVRIGVIQICVANLGGALIDGSEASIGNIASIPCIFRR